MPIKVDLVPVKIKVDLVPVITVDPPLDAPTTDYKHGGRTINAWLRGHGGRTTNPPRHPTAGKSYPSLHICNAFKPTKSKKSIIITTCKIQSNTFFTLSDKFFT